MAIQPTGAGVSGIGAYPTPAAKAATSSVKAAEIQKTPEKPRPAADSIEISQAGKEAAQAPAETPAKTATKGLDAKQLKALQEQQITSFKNMLAQMLNKQAGASSQLTGSNITLTKDLFANLKVDAATSAQASEAISENGEWGVKAVAGRIMDMAVALSGGDNSKLQMLKEAVYDGFSAAEKQWGGALPSITQQTRAEIDKRFEYWEANGSLDGYVME